MCIFANSLGCVSDRQFVKRLSIRNGQTLFCLYVLIKTAIRDENIVNEAKITTKSILDTAKYELSKLDNKTIDVLDISKPVSLEYAKQLAKVISKLSPLIGNMIEFSTVDLLNDIDWKNQGKWIRQDPGFPDALFISDAVKPNPGIEINYLDPRVEVLF